MAKVGAERWCLGWCLAGLVAIAGYYLTPTDTVARDLVYDGIGLVSAVMIVVGVRRHRPTRPALWYWFAAGQAVWVAGDLVYGYHVYVLGEEPFPSTADGLYLAAYPILLVGLVLLVRGRSAGSDLPGLLDAGIVATGLGLLSWTFLMRPIVEDTSQDMMSRLILLAYPAADLLLLAMVARLVIGRGARTASYRLLAGAMVLLLCADVMFSIQTALAGYASDWVDAGWLLSYVAWAAAALHPSMRTLSHAAAPGPVRLTRWRIPLLAVASSLAPALLLQQGLAEDGQVDWIAIGLGALVLLGLVLARMSGLVIQVQLHVTRLADLALRDDLTGLANRRLLHRRVDRALAADPGGVHIAMIDLDDFKSVNDRLGHAVGDQVLVAVGEQLRRLVRPVDTVARLGGDEFALLLPGLTGPKADRILERISAALRLPVTVAGHDLILGASIGVTDAVGLQGPRAAAPHGGAPDDEVPDGGALDGGALDGGALDGGPGETGAGTETPSHRGFELLRRADIALYEAKNTGKGGCVRYRDDLDRRATEVARLGAHLRLALDAGQFELVYQPIVTLPHGTIAGVETLLRWNRPQHGPISPAVFVPVAESNGLIVELGRWVLHQACRQAAAWHHELGPLAPAKISVNVSARQLREPGFARTVAAILDDTGLPPHRLVVEVTETAVFDGGPALRELTAVHDLGVGIALDDFGTGHSSLGLLQTCPVDILKVDKSFIDDIRAGGAHPVIAAALVSVSAGLNLTAIAEGVENREQADQLYQLGYRHAQGFYFAHPMSATKLHALLTGAAAEPGSRTGSEHLALTPSLTG